MRPSCGTYISCVTGFAIFCAVSFFSNGGGILLKDFLADDLGEQLGPLEPPLPWQRITPAPGSAAEAAITGSMIFILVVHAWPLLQWTVGFLWPLGIVKCPCCSRRRRRHSTTSSSVRRLSRCGGFLSVPVEISADSKSGGEEEKTLLLSEGEGEVEERSRGRHCSRRRRSDTAGVPAEECCDVERGRDPSSRTRIVSLRVVTRGDSPEFIWDACNRNVQALISYFRRSGRRRRRVGSKSDSETDFHAAAEYTDTKNAEEAAARSDGDENYEDVYRTNGRDSSKSESLENDVVEWILEVVTERPLDIAKNVVCDEEWCRVFEIVVPSDYRTPKETNCKARNLHYANQPGVSVLEDEDFIVHLDEETLVTEGALEGITDFIHWYPDCIGQGMTVFGRTEKVGNYLLTMCDTTRFIDDYCCFRLWHSLGSSLRGMKGSNFVVRVGIERFVSFDCGPRCSLLEDAAFALTAGQKGVKFGHYPGLMYEQSPIAYSDYFRQRRRWINGLMNVCCESCIRFRYRLLLIWSLISWLFAPLSFIAFFTVMCCFEVPVSFVSVFTRVLITAPAAWGAVWGAAFNFSPASRGICLYPLLVVGNFVALPLCTILESVAILFAVFARTQKFQVVRKRLASWTASPS